MRDVLSGQLRVQSITAEKPYLSALRTQEGQLQALPSLLAGRPATAPAPRPLIIGRVGALGVEGVEAVGEAAKGAVRQIFQGKDEEER